MENGPNGAADKLGNVSEVSGISGISRDIIYLHRYLLKKMVNKH